MAQSIPETMAASRRLQVNSMESSTTKNSIGLLSFLYPHESIQTWLRREQLFLSQLKIGDDEGAFLSLKSLTGRFGVDNDRVQAHRGLYREAVAEDLDDLHVILNDYDEILHANPTFFAVLKRRVVVLCTLGRHEDAIEALVKLLDNVPTDVEAWAELSEIYFSQSMLPQALYCLEEILVIAPKAWNIHARMGELLYISSLTADGNVNELYESIRRFCRCVELCEGSARGLYGLVLAAERFLSLETTTFDSEASEGHAFACSAREIAVLAEQAKCRLRKVSKTDQSIKELTSKRIQDLSGKEGH